MYGTLKMVTDSNLLLEAALDCRSLICRMRAVQSQYHDIKPAKALGFKTAWIERRHDQLVHFHLEDYNGNYPGYQSYMFTNHSYDLRCHPHSRRVLVARQRQRRRPPQTGAPPLWPVW
jgi:hypothetical protein